MPGDVSTHHDNFHCSLPGDVDVRHHGLLLRASTTMKIPQHSKKPPDSAVVRSSISKEHAVPRLC